MMYKEIPYHKDNSLICSTLAGRLGLFNRCDFQFIFENFILGAYAKSSRVYYDFSYIRKCWSIMERYKSSFEFINEASLAIIFQDIKQGFNHEKRSVDTMIFFMRPLNLPAKIITGAEGLILNTYQPGNPQTNDGKLIHDIDLYRFSRSYKECLKDELKIRKEHPEMSNKNYFEARKAFLRRLLIAGPIYKHEVFSRLEKQAQANIEELMAAY